MRLLFQPVWGSYVEEVKFAGGIPVEVAPRPDCGPDFDLIRAAPPRLNRAGADGERRVRLHAVGFPRGFRGGGQIPPTAIRFSTLMRVLCDRNGGTFVALTDENR